MCHCIMVNAYVVESGAKRVQLTLTEFQKVLAICETQGAFTTSHNAEENFRTAQVAAATDKTGLSELVCAGLGGAYVSGRHSET